MFINNKYKHWYDSIIKSANNRQLNEDEYYERHHIVPKSIGGSNDAENLVTLTTREHFVCHRLLVKFVDDEYKRRKMLHALGMFLQNGQGQQRILSSREYAIVRQANADARRNMPRSKETRDKISKSLKGNTPWNKGTTGDERLVWPEERKQRLSATNKGRKLTAEHAEKIRQAKLGHTAGMTGKTHSEETRRKMSESSKGKRGPQKRLTCPHCGTEQVTSRHIKFCKGMTHE